MNSGDDGFTGVAPVGCYAPSAFGLYDMIGNVWELTTDAYTPSHADPTPRTSSRDAHTARPAAGGQRVIKGGSYLCAPSYCLRYRAGSRQAQDDDLGASHVGFRTVLEATGR